MAKDNFRHIFPQNIPPQKEMKNCIHLLVMKMYASILSFYIMCLAFAPAIGFVYSRLSSGCGDSCAAVPEKKGSGCEKQACSFFFCCLNNIGFPPQQYKYSMLFRPESAARNNFTFNRTFISLKSFDIWHPPRLI